jgi:hypothetical protein
MATSYDHLRSATTEKLTSNFSPQPLSRSVGSNGKGKSDDSVVGSGSGVNGNRTSNSNSNGNSKINKLCERIVRMHGSGR